MALNITTPVACEANTFGDPPPWTHGRTVSELSSTPPEGHDAFGSAIRLHVDNGILGLFGDDLKASENHWRNLYYERVRCGNNTELWFTTRAVAFMAKAIIAQSKDAGQRHLYTLFCRLAMEEKLLPFLEDVVSQDDFYAEYPDFVMSILDIVIALLSTSRSEPSLFARVRRIIVSLCNTSWNRRTLLVDDPTVDQFYPAGRRGVRHQLYLVMMAVIRPTDFAARFGYGHEIRRTSFLCWYLCPDIELDNIAYSAAMLDHGIMGRPTETYWGQELHRTMKSVEEVMELDVLPAIGARPYLERLLKMLQCDVLIDGSLDLAITGALMSFHSSTALLANLAPSGVFKAIIQAVDRQALQGKPGMLSKPMCELLGMYSVIISKSIMHGVPELQPAISAFIRDGRIV
ncbi:hypothetical protein PENSPDRAFT_395430 [Peniophora sp. CONT]|nr:hypothetical protein PENSPDRAFT_395430 [Peniophora sp. CONT]